MEYSHFALLTDEGMIEKDMAKANVTQSSALRVAGLSKSFGDFKAVTDVSFSLSKGERRALIGPNGAGKTTLVNLLTGAFTPTDGTIWLGGKDVTSLPAHLRIQEGLARTFQITNLFNSLTVLENIALAGAERKGEGWHMFRKNAFSTRALEQAERVMDLIGLTRDAFIEVSDLPYGRQRLVELGIALALDPKILVLDEPAAGLPSEDHDIILAALDALPKDLAVLMIEHDIELVFRFASHVTVLAEGKVVSDGSGEFVKNDPKVREVYLGESTR
ncbi:ABC transporter ATP-binding protein [Roseibium sp. SCP14]|uniref:ABC transporter ATP-binding protein n=1 Tax=Roseibium sp. SCP14 TaxID=3141375 RepID=UPI0033375243